MDKITIVKLLKRNWTKAIIIVLLIVITSFLSTYPLNLLREIIDTGVLSFNGQIQQDIAVKTIIRLAITYFIVQVLQALFHNFSSYYNSTLQEILAHDVRCDVYNHLSSVPQNFFDNNDSSELLNRLIQDSSIAIRGFMVPITYLTRSIFSFAFGFYFMAKIDIRLTLIILPLAVTSGIITRLSGTKFWRFARENRRKNAKMWGYYQENIKGMRDIHASSQEDNRYAQVVDTSLQVVDNHKKTQRYSAKINFLNTFFFVLIITTMLSAGGIMVVYGLVSVGGVSAILMYNDLLASPISNFVGMFLEMQNVNVSLQRLNKIMEFPIDESYKIKNNEVDISNVDIAVKFEHVNFSYIENKPVIKDLSFEVKKGETHAFVGTTGSGKTTVLKVIEGLYLVNDGKIEVFGYPLNAQNKLALRKHIGYVFQDTFLFNATIKENIMFAAPNATMEQLNMAIKIACVDEIIVKTTDGVDTLVGENGIKLSGGERQRIGIARIILRNPSLILFDEATSALDNNTELKVINGIREYLKDTTFIMIAHRLSTIEKSDCIYLLEDGVIVEQGTQEQLMALNGKYKTMYEAHLLNDRKE
jgi:ATP-binding cassette subfamily B protein/subfamily B ATP-binding cassette protein MsbA